MTAHYRTIAIVCRVKDGESVAIMEIEESRGSGKSREPS